MQLADLLVENLRREEVGQREIMSSELVVDVGVTEDDRVYHEGGWQCGFGCLYVYICIYRLGDKGHKHNDSL